MRASSLGHLPYVDGLRAIAVLAVVVYHLDAAWLPGGFAGVDVFFVISGFVVTASLASRPPEPALGFALSFYARRWLRIVPALLVCLLVSGLLGVLLIPEAWLSQGNHKVGLAAFLGLGNLALIRQSGDYFAPAAEYNLYTHTWSLGVEEQFYLLFPLLFLFGIRRPRMTLGLFAGIGLLSLFCAMYWAEQGRHAWNFYGLPSRFWQLALGVCLYLILSSRNATQRDLITTGQGSRWRSLAVWGALLALGASLFSVRPTHMPWPDAVLPSLATAALLGLLYRQPMAIWPARWLSSAPMQAIGRCSYALYLWHWPVFVLMRWTLGLDSVATRVLALVIAVVMAVLSWHFVEQPIRFSERLRRVSPGRMLLIGLLIVLLCGWGFDRLYRAQAPLSLSRVMQNGQDWYPEQMPDVAAQRCQSESKETLHGGLLHWHYRPKPDCSDAVTPARIFVLGDSHAISYMILLRGFVAEAGMTLHLYHRPGCPMIGLSHAGEQQDPACREAISEAFAQVEKHAQPGDLVFLPSLRVPRMGDQWRGGSLVEAQQMMREPAMVERIAVGEAQALARLQPLAERGVAIVFELPKPVLPAPPYRCADAFNRNNPVCAGGLSVSRQDMEDLRAPVVAALERLAGTLAGASVWDPLPILCEPDVCHAYRGDRPLFFDGDHVSGHGNALLAPRLTTHVAEVLAR